MSNFYSQDAKEKYNVVDIHFDSRDDENKASPAAFQIKLNKPLNRIVMFQMVQATVRKTAALAVSDYLILSTTLVPGIPNASVGGEAAVKDVPNITAAIARIPFPSDPLGATAQTFQSEYFQKYSCGPQHVDSMSFTTTTKGDSNWAATDFIAGIIRVWTIKN
jgi:hypothetical protein